MSNFMNFRLTEAKLFYADEQKYGRTGGETDRQTATVKQVGAFNNVAEVPKLHL
jgi:hypothetical protein